MPPCQFQVQSYTKRTSLNLVSGTTSAGMCVSIRCSLHVRLALAESGRAKGGASQEASRGEGDDAGADQGIRKPFEEGGGHQRFQEGEQRFEGETNSEPGQTKGVGTFIAFCPRIVVRDPA